jgi:PAS domain S-box-containing protein
LNQASFAAFAGFPIDIPRIFVLSLFCAILGYEYHLTWGSTGRAAAFALGIIMILAGGWVGTQIAGLRAAQAERAHLSEDTTTIMSGVNPARLRGLTLSPADLESPDFMRLREQLVTIAAYSHDAHAITLTVEREGKVNFVTDSLPQGHANHARPGDPYDEYPTELHTVSVTGQAAIAGPYTNQRGTFISGFSAIRDLASGEVLGVLGVDWEDAQYALAVASSCLIPIALTIIASLCFLVYHIFLQRSHESALLLAASERSMRLAQAISQVGSWVRDTRTGRSEWSAEMFTIFGVDSARGTPTIEEQRALLSPSDWERELEAEKRAERDGVGFEVDLRIERHDGGIRYAVSRGGPVRDHHGNITSVAGILQDLTVRHEAQAEVRRLAQQMEFILAASRTG